MTEAQLALARRAVACKRWRGMPGMLVSGIQPHPEDDPGAFAEGCERLGRDADPSLVGSLPDLTDPATLGCLLELVRAAHRDEIAFCAPYAEGEGPYTWDVCDRDGATIASGHATEAEALVAALEAAP